MEQFVVTGENPYLHLATTTSLFEAMQLCIVQIMEDDGIDKPIRVELVGGPSVYLLQYGNHIDWIHRQLVLENSHAKL